MPRGYEIPAPAPAETAIVIANGPSLRDVDLSRFDAFATFGMNAAYRHWNRIGWRPTHYACLDEVVGLSHADAIGEMIRAAEEGGRPGRFLLRRNLIERLGEPGGSSRVAEFESLALGSRALSREPVTTGSHTLIWALTLGYRTAFVIGADCNYVEVVEGASPAEGHVLEIVRAAANPNYFFDDYQQVGDRYNVPNVEADSHLRAWRAAGGVAAELEAEAYNLSPGSRVDAFDFADLEALLAGRPVPVSRR